MLVLLLLVAAGGAGVLALQRDDDTDWSGEAEIVLPAGSDRAAVLDAVERLPDRGGTLVLGAARLEVTDPGRSFGELAQAFVAASRIDVPGAGVELAQGFGAQAIVGTVQRRDDGPELARQILARLAPRGVWPAGISGMRVEAQDAPGLLVSVARQVGSAQAAATAALTAATALARLTPEVSIAPAGVHLRVQAEDPAAVGSTWRTTARALKARKDVRVYVDVVEDGNRRPVLSGPASDSPQRALALLRVLEGDAYVTTDRSFARVRLERPEDAPAVARTARSVDRLQLAWTVADEDTSWFDAAGVDRAATSLDDAPATVERLLGGVERAQEDGLAPLSWSRQAVDGIAELKLARPPWIDPEARLAEDEDQLRRLARTIRTVGWPGTARFDIALGPGSCAQRADALAVAEVTSTSDGQARSVEPAAACIDDEALAAVRRAWNATAR